jgi:hypothetical protein
MLRLITRKTANYVKNYLDTDIIYDETFHKDNSGQSIVLDVVPPQNCSIADLIKHFKTRSLLYRKQYPKETLITIET